MFAKYGPEINVSCNDHCLIQLKLYDKENISKRVVGIGNPEGSKNKQVL